MPFTEVYTPSDEYLFFAVSAYTALAATIRDTFGEDVAPVFARIDVIRDAANTLFVNSVELVDPVLFFSKVNGAARTFVSTVTDYVRSVRGRLGISSPATPTTPASALQLPLPLLPPLPEQQQQRGRKVDNRGCCQENSLGEGGERPTLFLLLLLFLYRLLLRRERSGLSLSWK